ncbi:MAG: O-antigen ligase family protein [Candidatus Falkowbacteria bacterium]|nr:O-antigen ligase family protein [Candidatus Falkowbacteria bacterium]
MNLFNKTFQITILTFFIVELFSFCGYLVPAINVLVFCLLALITLALTWKKLEYGLLIVLAELFIGSKGYLFFLSCGEKIISLRLALWLIVMGVWFIKLVFTTLKTKKITFALRESANFYYFLIFFFIIIFGIFNGVIHHHTSANIFFDANGWLYLALIFPAYDVILKNSSQTIANILQVFTAAVFWLAIKTIFLVFAFSHNIGDLIFIIYRWVRESGVGEITLIKGGFYRIFFQSHINVLVAFFLWLLILITNSTNKFLRIKNLSQKQLWLIAYLILTIIFSVNLVNFSRSNWLGLIGGGLFLFIYLLFQKKWRTASRLLIFTGSSFVISIFIILLIVYFPWPQPIGGFNAAKLLSERASALTEEAGASSRWSLLPKLWSAIKNAPIVGQGFGATITYQTSDPRILENNPNGLYKTYAFEWGWLDIWLKLGAIGMLYYIFLLAKIYFWDLYKSNFKNLIEINQPEKIIILFFSLGMLVISLVNISSPYLNHPLGFGYLVISAAIIEKTINNKKGIKAE